MKKKQHTQNKNTLMLKLKKTTDDKGSLMDIKTTCG